MSAIINGSDQGGGNDRAVPRKRSQAFASLFGSADRNELTVEFGDAKILKMREEIKIQTFRKRRLQHQAVAA